MNKQQAKEVMAAAFQALTEKQRERLRWHAEEGTGILCGIDAHHYWKNGSG